MLKKWPTLIEQIYSYTPLTTKEQETKATFIDFLTTSSNCFSRGNLERHFTGSALLFSEDLNRVLLTLHKKLGKWLQLGGHCDNNQSTLSVALQEAKEESGINSIKVLHEDIFAIDIHPIPQFNTVAPHYHYDVSYLLKAEADDNSIEISNESIELRWFPIHNIHKCNVDEHVKLLVDRYIRVSSLQKSYC